MTLYCIDSSVLIQAGQRLAPMDINTTFWSNFEALVRDGRAIAPDEVLREIEKKDDEVHGWCKQLNGSFDSFFLPLDDDVQDAASQILAEFPKLVDDRPNKGQADPFVIALARTKQAVVVTQEVSNLNSNGKRPKIPDVCKHYGVRCIDFLALVREEKWKW